MSAPSMIGRQVAGNYTIVSPLGEGGMGAVYVAQHNTLPEKLAIKVLHPEFASRPEIVSRFVSEAMAASAIKHPNIVRVFDVGQFPGGEHYIALEFLDGYPLDQPSFPLPLDMTLQVMVQVCMGLEAAHARGIIHRDLKPANLYVTPQPGNPLLTKILDFGIAKLTGQSIAGEARTHAQAVMGTPAYMSPEQAGGSANVTVRSDIYALGAILFEFVTGQKPYAVTSIGDLVRQQLTTPTPDPSRLRPGVPAPWAQIISACLAVDPAARPASARDLAALLVQATPRGAELARAVGAGDFVAASARAEPAALPAAAGATVTLGAPATPATPATPRTVVLDTTLSGAAAQSDVLPRPRRRSRGLLYSTIGAIGIGVTALLFLLSRGGDDNNVAPAARETPSTTAAPLPTAADAGVAPADAAPAAVADAAEITAETDAAQKKPHTAQPRRRSRRQHSGSSRARRRKKPPAQTKPKPRTAPADSWEVKRGSDSFEVKKTP